MAVDRKEELEINESSLIKEMLIYELQEVEKEEGFKIISSRKELVNFALINLLQDYKEDKYLEVFVNSLSENLEFYFKEKFQVKKETVPVNEEKAVELEGK